LMTTAGDLLDHKHYIPCGWSYWPL